MTNNEIKNQTKEIKKIIEEITKKKAVCLNQIAINDSLHTEWAITNCGVEALITVGTSGIYGIKYTSVEMLIPLHQIDEAIMDYYRNR